LPAERPSLGCASAGLQQLWLEEMEPMLWSMGKACYLGGADGIPQHKCGIYSRRWLVP